MLHQCPELSADSLLVPAGVYAVPASVVGGKKTDGGGLNKVEI